MTGYERIAISLCNKNPEGKSIVVLVLIELWIACDKIATGQTPLLQRYDPCIPPDLLQSLLLPFREQMVRLAKIEEYLEKRFREADPLLPYIFSSFGDTRPFGVQYYNQSTDHQNLMAEIEAMAAKHRLEKIAELHKVQAQYRRLQTRFETASCLELSNKRGRSYTVHSFSCSKCSYEKMDALTIKIHEWPLPRSDTDAKATVFELRLPIFFYSWRDATTFILLDVLKCRYGPVGFAEQEQNLSDYSALSNFYTRSYTSRRISLQSSTKPHIITHRRTKSVPNLDVDDVCLHNGLISLL